MPAPAARPGRRRRLAAVEVLHQRARAAGTGSSSVRLLIAAVCRPGSASRRNRLDELVGPPSSPPLARDQEDYRMLPCSARSPRRTARHDHPEPRNGCRYLNDDRIASIRCRSPARRTTGAQRVGRPSLKLCAETLRRIRRAVDAIPRAAHDPDRTDPYSYYAQLGPQPWRQRFVF